MYSLLVVKIDRDVFSEKKADSNG